ncbi:MAG: hypothetical protein L7R66_02400, partial [Candidatus Thalassarchaeaceae archaeon]|nr:hypothetical protein [Candidatus Thalassarchaeaceae archaeon]
VSDMSAILKFLFGSSKETGEIDPYLEVHSHNRNLLLFLLRHHFDLATWIPLSDGFIPINDSVWA